MPPNDTLTECVNRKKDMKINKNMVQARLEILLLALSKFKLINFYYL